MADEKPKPPKIITAWEANGTRIISRFDGDRRMNTVEYVEKKDALGAEVWASIPVSTIFQHIIDALAEKSAPGKK